MKFVLASNNAKKIAELRTILKEKLPQIELLSLKDAGIFDEIEEDGVTFEQNSIIKASVPAKLGYVGIADDSGLCVDALDGAPGIYSARYSGGGDKENNEKLLKDLKGKENREAHYVCVMSAVFPDGRIIVGRGEAHGKILEAPRGKDGFGYDPLFYSYSLNKTFAEAEADEKNKVSHRRAAIEILCEKLKNEI